MTHIVESFPDINGAIDNEGDYKPLTDFDDSFGAEFPVEIREEKEPAVEAVPSPKRAMAKRAILPYNYEEGESAYSDLGGGLPGREVSKSPQPKVSSGSGIELARQAKLAADAAAGVDINSTEYKAKARAAAENRGRRY